MSTESAPKTRLTVTVRASANIALVKYWGKRDEEKMLPLNDSISVSIDELTATTSVQMTDGSCVEDDVIINGKVHNTSANTRFERCFAEARRMRRKRKATDDGNDQPECSFHVTSSTSFPASIGLASSAAGHAALALAMGHLLDWDTATVSRMARLGSGSACRSVLPGFVHWHADDGRVESLPSTSLLSQLRCVILITSNAEKPISSTLAMHRCVQSSELLKYRSEHCVPARIARVRRALVDADWPALAKEICADSDQMHAICADAQPPIRFLTDASYKLIDLIVDFNRRHTHDSLPVAYTFDAGPNACLFMLENSLDNFMQYILHRVHIIGDRTNSAVIGWNMDKLNVDAHERNFAVVSVDLLQVIVSKCGGGPTIL